MLQRSYAAVGGFKSAANVEELVQDSSVWKLVTRDGELSAVAIYKDKHGRKSIAVGTDGTDQGKRDLMMVKSEDVKLQRSWAEVSGAPEKLMTRLGAQPVPNKYAAALTGKEVLSLSDDGYHYTRLIAGRPYEKIILGIPQPDAALLSSLQELGVDLQDFPKKA